MGAAMATRLLGQGNEVVVYNRTKEKAQGVLDAGAKWRSAPAMAAADVDVVFTFVTDASALEAVSFGDDGILHGINLEAVHCDMSTIAPPAAAAIAKRYADSGRRYVQAPVLGSWKQILEGSLLVFGGGAADNLDRCQPVWDSFAKQVWRFDTVEQSAAAKLACNILIGQMIVGLGQTLALASEGGVDVETMLDIIGASNLASPMYASKGKQIADKNFKPNFIVRNMLKDLRLASDYANDKALTLPANDANRELFVKAIADGFGDEDYSAVVKTMIKQE
jgi:3-hydroxyisobutyrate dehydrogenase-like beta-hydroxyacid dehydrogenase